MYRTLVILNPGSGSKNEDTPTTIHIVMRDLGRSYDLRLTQGAGDAQDWAGKAKDQGYTEVWVAGGDGTICEAINGLMRTEPLPLGVLPLGTANGLARFLKMPLNLEEALETNAKGKHVNLDVGYVVNADRHFMLFAGAGIDAETVANSPREAKDKLGGLAYVKAAVSSLTTQKSQQFNLTLDGETHYVEGHSVVAFNASDFQIAGMSIGPVTSGVDGVFDIFVIQDLSLMTVARTLIYFLSGRAQPESLRRFQASYVKIESEYPLKTQIDGDVLGETPLELTLKPKALPVIAPSDFNPEVIS